MLLRPTWIASFSISFSPYFHELWNLFTFYFSPRIHSPPKEDKFCKSFTRFMDFTKLPRPSWMNCLIFTIFSWTVEFAYILFRSHFISPKIHTPPQKKELVLHLLPRTLKKAGRVDVSLGKNFFYFTSSRTYWERVK